ncbi:MAG: helix-turn-helix domain-containing protein [Candidatus Dormibacteria bacterium]
MSVDTGVPQLLLTPEEAARVLRIGRTRAGEIIRHGDITSVLIGRRRLVPVEAIERYIAENSVGRGAPAHGADAPGPG